MKLLDFELNSGRYRCMLTILGFVWGVIISNQFNISDRINPAKVMPLVIAQACIPALSLYGGTQTCSHTCSNLTYATSTVFICILFTVIIFGYAPMFAVSAAVIAVMRMNKTGGVVLKCTGFIATAAMMVGNILIMDNTAVHSPGGYLTFTGSSVVGPILSSAAGFSVVIALSSWDAKGNPYQVLAYAMVAATVFSVLMGFVSKMAAVDYGSMSNLSMYDGGYLAFIGNAILILLAIVFAMFSMRMAWDAFMVMSGVTIVVPIIQFIAKKGAPTAVHVIVGNATDAVAGVAATATVLVESSVITFQQQCGIVITAFAIACVAMFLHFDDTIAARYYQPMWECSDCKLADRSQRSLFTVDSSEEGTNDRSQSEIEEEARRDHRSGFA